MPQIRQHIGLEPDRNTLLQHPGRSVFQRGLPKEKVQKAIAQPMRELRVGRIAAEGLSVVRQSMVLII